MAPGGVWDQGKPGALGLGSWGAPHPASLRGPRQGHPDGTGLVGARWVLGQPRRGCVPPAPGRARLGGTGRAGLPGTPLVPCPMVTFAMD